jgi:hypothetical protein
MMPVLAPFLLKFKEAQSRVNRYEKIQELVRTISDDGHKSLSLELVEENEENEAQNNQEEIGLFELNRPTRNFVTFVTAPIVKFAYFQVNLF